MRTSQRADVDAGVAADHMAAPGVQVISWSIKSSEADDPGTDAAGHALVLPAAGASAALRNPCPDAHASRAGRLRPGSIDCESSRVNFSGHVPTLLRSTATGAPGESTDLAMMNSVAPAAAFAFNAGASEIHRSPTWGTAGRSGSHACQLQVLRILAATIFASAESAGDTACSRRQATTAAA